MATTRRRTHLIAAPSVTASSSSAGRALLTDNGAAMLAAETTEGLERLGIVHHTTLPYSPEQNGKQESFWGQIEGRLLPMLEGEATLTLELLNIASQAWVEARPSPFAPPSLLPPGERQ